MKTYPLTQEQFLALRTRLLQQGVSIPQGTDGTISQSGVVLKYHYDNEQQRLTLSIVQKPWIASSGMIWDQVDRWIAGGQ